MVFDGWKVAVCTQVIQCLDITAACSLYIKTFLDSLQSGFMDNRDLQRKGNTHYYSNDNESQHSRTHLTGIESTNQLESTKGSGVKSTHSNNVIRLQDMKRESANYGSAATHKAEATSF